MSDDLEAARARKRYNQMIIDRVRGLPAQPGTPSTDADPNNPNVTSTAMREAEKKAREVADMLETWANGLACLTDGNEKRAAQNYMLLLREAAHILRQLRRDTIEECARVAEKYAQTPVGNDRQDTAEAFAMGLTYQTGGADNALAIRDAIRKLAQEG